MTSRVSQIIGHLNATPENPKDDHASATREYLESRIGRPRLEDKICVITGGGTPTGIGRAAGFAFAANGAPVVYLTDISTQHLEANANEIMKKWPSTKVIPVRVDASNEDDVKGVWGN